MKNVYFLKPIGMAGPIKIGRSNWPDNRLKACDIWSPFPLELIASAPGENREEGRLHWRFRESRSHAAERAMRTRQRALDLDLPMQRRDAA